MDLALTAFLTGLFSAAHCLSMCGGILGALNLPQGRSIRIHSGGSASLTRNAAGSDALLMQFAYAGGRIASYSIAGALMGGLGAALALSRNLLPLQLGLAVLANVAIMLLGFRLAGLGNVFARAEGFGLPLWRRIAPFTRRFMPADTPPRALAVGAIWGWLPCALVYGVLPLALLSGTAIEGAGVMAAFGLGTLPAMVAAGFFIDRLRVWLTRRPVQLLAGGIVFLTGLAGLARIPELRRLIEAGLLCLG